jgi:ribulose-bisphosphate carboxylase small chain
MPLTNETGNYETAQTLETFGFLPKMDQREIEEQIAYVIANGWTPSIEHEHPSKAFNHYWTMWKLPFFGERDLAAVVAELEACHRANPDHHVRLIGYDNYTQCQGLSFVVYEGRA